MRCEKCGNKLLQKIGASTILRLDGKIEFLEGGGCRAKCHWCRTPVTLPLSLGTAATEEERFTIPDGRLTNPEEPT